MTLNLRKLKVVIWKEWEEGFKNKLVLFTVIFLPLILTVLPIGTIVAIDAGGEEMAQGQINDVPDEFFGELCVDLNEMDCAMVYMTQIFTILFMMVPVIIPATFASYSIVGEKNSRTLEPLLATPITTTELIVAKATAAVVPAVGATWLGYGIYAIAGRFLVNDLVFNEIVAPYWLVAIFIVGPLLSLFGVGAGIIVSSRVTDPRAAEQISGLIVLPLILLMLGQSFGLLLINQQVILIMGVVVAVLDVIVLYFAIQLFQRETILTRWK